VGPDGFEVTEKGYAGKGHGRGFNGGEGFCLEKFICLRLTAEAVVPGGGLFGSKDWGAHA